MILCLTGASIFSVMYLGSVLILSVSTLGGAVTLSVTILGSRVLSSIYPSKSVCKVFCLQAVVSLKLPSTIT